jgi:hypothetical protein
MPLLQRNRNNRTFRSRPDASLYSTLLSASLQLQDAILTRAIIGHYEKSNIQTNPILFTMILKAFSQLEENEKAFNLWQQIKVSDNSLSRLGLLFISSLYRIQTCWMVC